MLFKHTLHYGKMFAPDGDGGGGAAAGAEGENGGGEGDAGNGSGDNSGGDDIAGLKSALDKERKAARDAGKQLKTALEELNQIKNAGKSDEEKRDADLKAALAKAEAAETKLRDANARSAVTDAATKANAISPRAVFALIKSDLEFDDDGEPTNVDALLKAAMKDEPSLFRAANGSGDGGKGGAAHQANDINSLLRSMAQDAT